MDIETSLRELEGLTQAYPGQLPGTIISRTFLDKSFCPDWDIFCPPGKEAAIVWSLGLGGLSEPKLFVYGSTIEHAIENAHKYRALLKEVGNLIRLPSKALIPKIRAISDKRLLKHIRLWGAGQSVWEACDKRLQVLEV